MVKKLNTEEFNLLIDRTQALMQEHGSVGMRSGQAYMLALKSIREDMYAHIIEDDVEIDTWFEDNNIGDFLRYIGDEDVNNFLNLKKHG